VHNVVPAIETQPAQMQMGSLAKIASSVLSALRAQGAPQQTDATQPLPRFNVKEIISVIAGLAPMVTREPQQVPTVAMGSGFSTTPHYNSNSSFVYGPGMTIGKSTNVGTLYNSSMPYSTSGSVYNGALLSGDTSYGQESGAVGGKVQTQTAAKQGGWMDQASGLLTGLTGKRGSSSSSSKQVLGGTGRLTIPVRVMSTDALDSSSSSSSAASADDSSVDLLTNLDYDDSDSQVQVAVKSKASTSTSSSSSGGGRSSAGSKHRHKRDKQQRVQLSSSHLAAAAPAAARAAAPVSPVTSVKLTAEAPETAAAGGDAAGDDDAAIVSPVVAGVSDAPEADAAAYEEEYESESEESLAPEPAAATAASAEGAKSAFADDADAADAADAAADVKMEESVAEAGTPIFESGKLPQQQQQQLDTSLPSIPSLNDDSNSDSSDDTAADSAADSAEDPLYDAEDAAAEAANASDPHTAAAPAAPADSDLPENDAEVAITAPVKLQAVGKRVLVPPQQQQHPQQQQPQQQQEALQALAQLQELARQQEEDLKKLTILQHQLALAQQRQKAKQQPQRPFQQQQQQLQQQRQRQREKTLPASTSELLQVEEAVASPVFVDAITNHHQQQQQQKSTLDHSAAAAVPAAGTAAASAADDDSYEPRPQAELHSETDLRSQAQPVNLPLVAAAAPPKPAALPLSPLSPPAAAAATPAAAAAPAAAAPVAPKAAASALTATPAGPVRLTRFTQLAAAAAARRVVPGAATAAVTVATAAPAPAPAPAAKQQ
jgi:hypothetical protein